MSSPASHPLAADLDHVLAHTAGIWDELRGARIFVTGGTGFIGCWLLESFAWACDRLPLDASVTVLTRSPEAFHEKAPHLANHPAIRLVRGDVRSFEFPEGPFTHVIHGATEAYPKDCLEQPLAVLDALLEGVRHILDFAVAASTRRFLLISTGAVYGQQPPEITHLPETYRGAPVPTEERALYAEGKRISELLCALYQQEHGLESIITRGFAFVGPYMPLEAYAIGNFIRDRIEGRPIHVKGDGRPLRSYLYTADLAIWLWTLLVEGQPGRPYNVGSEQALSIAAVAEAVATALPPYTPLPSPAGLVGAAPGMYVPSTERARSELGLQQWIPLEQAIRRTAAWYQATSERTDGRAVPYRCRAGRTGTPVGGGRCRVCGGNFFPAPLLRYEGMPRGAQAFPDKESLDADTAADLEVCECSGCGLIQLSDGPVPYYRDVIRAAAVSPEMSAFRTQQFDAFVRKFALQGKKVLEVGCGRGEFLCILQKTGARSIGLEHSQASVDHCTATGLTVAKGFIPDDASGLAGQAFDAFLMLNFLEHLPAPAATLRGIGRFLASGAVGMVEVPNFEMILKSRLFSEFISDHVLYFTRDTLVRTLNLSGFEVLECGVIWHDYIVSATVRKRCHSDFSGFHEAQTRLEREIDSYLRRFGERKVAVWGAGHQAIAILSLAKLGNRIKYVVDSAPFKQGKYTPSSHLPIVPPEALRSDPAEAVIVMAASYSDEVARIIRMQFDPSINVAILRTWGLEVVSSRYD